MNTENKEGSPKEFAALANRLDAQVWSRSFFPSHLRPDLKTLVPLFTFDNSPSNGPGLHPIIENFQQTEQWQDLVATGQAQTEEDYLAREAGIIVHYNPYTRAIAFSDHSTMLPKPDKLLALSNAIACDRILPAVITPFDDLAPAVKKETTAFMESLKQEFGLEFESDKASISRVGHSNYLLLDGLLVCPMTHPSMFMADKIYPTLFEMITAGISQYAGNESGFVLACQNGRLIVSDGDQHPNFSSVAKRLLQRYKWQDLLDAFSVPDFQVTSERLSKLELNFLDEIYAPLLDSIEFDEGVIAQMNAQYRSE